MCKRRREKKRRENVGTHVLIEIFLLSEEGEGERERERARERVSERESLIGTVFF